MMVLLGKSWKYIQGYIHIVGIKFSCNSGPPWPWFSVWKRCTALIVGVVWVHSPVLFLLLLFFSQNFPPKTCPVLWLLLLFQWDWLRGLRPTIPNVWTFSLIYCTTTSNLNQLPLLISLFVFKSILSSSKQTWSYYLFLVPHAHSPLMPK